MGIGGSGSVFNPFTMAGLVALIVTFVLFPARSHSSVPPSVGIRNRRLLMNALAGLWIADGFFQAQPLMWGHAFVADVLQPNLEGQPALISKILRMSYQIWDHHQVMANLASVIIQLGLGVWLWITRNHAGRAVPALWSSLMWSLVVWVFGEGLGGLMGGSPSFFWGAPGSALLYALLSVFVLIPEPFWLDGRATLWLRRVTGLSWIAGAALQTAPAYWTRLGLAQGLTDLGTTAQSTAGSGPILWLANWSVTFPIVLNAGIAAAMLVIGIACWRDWQKTWVFWGATTFLAFTWWFGQDFGMLLSGVGTDPGTVPLWAVMLWAGAPSESWGPWRVLGPGIDRVIDTRWIRYRRSGSSNREGQRRSQGS